MRKVIAPILFAVVMMLGMTALSPAQPLPVSRTAVPQAQQQNHATKTITGKVLTVASSGLAFSVETGDGPARQTMQFVVDKNTQVHGKVTTGTVAKVEYRSGTGGENVAVSVTAQ